MLYPRRWTLALSACCLLLAAERGLAVVPSAAVSSRATTAVLTGEYSARVWIALLLAYDVVFTIACLYLFETVLDAE